MTRCTCAALTIASLLAPASASTAQDRLTDLSLEDLMKIEITSVSRKEQSLARTPAAVFVITQDEIRRSGASTVPDLLRLVPGIEVARINASQWAISSRGFNHIFANKLLVLVDGRSVTSPLFSGVYWDLQDVMFDQIERIEVIRGPAGTVWGANTVNGVVSIITKRAADTKGLFMAVGTGSEDRGQAEFRAGGTAGRDAAYRLYGKFTDHDEPNGSDVLRNERQTMRAGFRVDWAAGANEVTVQGDAYGAGGHQPALLAEYTAPFSRLFEDRVTASGGDMVVRWTRSRSASSNFVLQGYYDQTTRHETLVGASTHTLDLDFQQRGRPARGHDVVWGLGYRNTFTSVEATDYMRLDPLSSHRFLVSGFAQDEIAIAPTVSLTVGAKLEQYEQVNLAFQPSVRALWSPGPRQAVWAALSRAVRTPMVDEQAAIVRLQVLGDGPAGLPVELRLMGSPSLRQLERVTASEVGYRAQPLTQLTVDLTAFRSAHGSVTSFDAGQPFVAATATGPYIVQPLWLGDAVDGHSHGVEAVAKWKAASSWTLSASYAYLQLDLEATAPNVTFETGPGVHLRNPHHQFAAQSTVRLPGGVDFDTSLFDVSRIPVSDIQAYARLDVGLRWRLAPGVDISAGVRNLTDPRHFEAGSFMFEAPSEVPRTTYARLTWRP